MMLWLLMLFLMRHSVWTRLSLLEVLDHVTVPLWTWTAAARMWQEAMPMPLEPEAWGG